jgi:hypothetical protein
VPIIISAAAANKVTLAKFAIKKTTGFQIIWGHGLQIRASGVSWRAAQIVNPCPQKQGEI